MFVDVENPKTTADELIETFSGFPHKLTQTSVILIRWPEVSTNFEQEYEESCDEGAKAWALAVADRAVAVGYGQLQVGIVRFRVGEDPVLTWAADDFNPTSDEVADLLHRAMQVELQTLLLWGRALWRPTSYHYLLPSGRHSGVFIRVGDAFRTARDVRVLSSWLTPRLRDNLSLLCDSATLIPLCIDLRSLMAQRGWTLGQIQTLDEYPRTLFDVARAVRLLRASADGVMALLSVSSSGHYRDLMYAALRDQSVDDQDWSMIVLVDLGSPARMPRYDMKPNGSGVQRVSTWIHIDDEPEDQLPSGECRWCANFERAQVVRIDPTSFEALALPGHRLITPDVTAARASLGLWQSCDAAGAVGVELKPESGPSLVSRPKLTRLPVAVDLSKLIEHSEGVLQNQVRLRLEELRRQGSPIDFGSESSIGACDGVLVSSFDLARPNFREFFDFLMSSVGLRGIEPTEVELSADAVVVPAAVSEWRHALIFSLGSVSGWSLRQLQLAAEDAWSGKHDRHLSGLVLHARPATSREWETLGRPLRDQLHAVWLTHLPWRSPLLEEQEHLFTAPQGTLTLGAEAEAFLQERRAYVSGTHSWEERVEAHAADDGTPDPYSLLWGLPPYGGGQDRVRTQSNYGFEVRAVTAYAAMGAAMQSARQSHRADDPRRPVFDLAAITRMYYDGLLIACILRWCSPQESHWGDSEGQARNAISELLSRTRDEMDQKVLFPELLLAASQGKIPHPAIADMIAEIKTQSADWPLEHRAGIELGLALVEQRLRPGALM